MARLGILACQIFERELAYILDRQEGIDRIYMRRCEGSRRIAGMMDREVTYFNDPLLLSPIARGNEVLVDVLPAALHTSIDELEYGCNEAMTAMRDVTSAVVLLYGLCGNALKSVIAREDVHVVTIEEDGVVDDCFVGLLGRREYDQLLQRRGSFFLTSGWVEHWGEIAPRIAGVQGMKPMLAGNGYERTLYVSIEGIDNDQTLDAAKALSSELELGHQQARGSTLLLEDAVRRGIEVSKTAKRIVKRNRSNR
jgi:hypothetical protein